MHHGCFLRSGAGINAAAATVITGANAVVLDRIVVDVMNAGSVYVRDRRVVVDAIVVPVGAVIAAARVAVAVVDAAVVTHVTAPIAGMPEITSVVISPPRRRPERANPGSQYPSPGNPIISGGCVIPVPGVPQVIITRSWGLVIFGQRRRRLAGLDVLIIVRSLLRVWIVTLILGVVVLDRGAGNSFDPAADCSFDRGADCSFDPAADCSSDRAAEGCRTSAAGRAQVRAEAAPIGQPTRGWHWPDRHWDFGQPDSGPYCRHLNPRVPRLQTARSVSRPVLLPEGKARGVPLGFRDCYRRAGNLAALEKARDPIRLRTGR